MNKYEKYVQDVRNIIEGSTIKTNNYKELEASGLLDSIKVDNRVRWIIVALNKLEEQELKIEAGDNRLKQQILIPKINYFLGKLETIGYYDIDVSDENFEKLNRDIEKLLLECENEMDAGTMLIDMLERMGCSMDSDN